MTNEDRLNLRARQILDDPTLSPNQRIDHPEALLSELVKFVKNDPVQMDALLSEITDLDVREKMRLALNVEHP